MSPVTTKCESCGEQFDQSGQEKYCSDECLRAGRLQGAKAQTQCASCGESFEYYPSRRTGKYCSPCYADDDKETVTRLTETANPRWNGGKRVCQCAVCGTRVERYPSQIGETVLCSKACHSAWLSDEFSGEGHPNGRVVETRTTAKVGERFDSRHLNEMGTSASSADGQTKSWAGIQTSITSHR